MHIPAARSYVRTARRIANAIALTALIIASIAPSASAAYVLETDPNFTTSTITGHGLGQSDQNGTLYLMSAVNGTKVFRYDKNGTRLTDITFPAGVNGARDVAPSPDGSFLYVSQGTSTYVRLNRQANGTYVKDTAWRLADLSVWGVKYTPVGWAIQTDGRGDIYISNGSYWVSNYVSTQSSVAKYSADGTFITAFGDYGKQPGNWITNQDVAVSRDGRRVYVGENCGVACRYDDPNYQGSRVTRYDFSTSGTYKFSRIISAQGAMDDNPFPRCSSAGATHSAYALTMDAKDNLYVTSTTCGRIQQYATSPDPAQDVFVRSVAINTDPATASGIQGKKNHYLTSDWAGRLYATEWGIKFTPKTIQVPATPLPPLAPLPTPDTTPPALVNVTLPAATTTRAVNVSIEATDNVAVAEMRLANEDGVWGPWQPFVTPVLHTISDGYAVKGIYVQVRDMADNRSAAVYKTLRYEKEAAPVVQDVADPILSTLAVPALTSVNAVTLSLQASDDVALRNMRFANEDGNWGAWEPYAATKAWNLSAGYGLKLVYAQVSDTSGKLSNVLTARSKVQQDAPLDPPPPNATPDTTAPLLATISLPTETTTQTVPVTLDASDNVAVAQARFANEDGIWGAWRAYTPTTDWLLTANFTTKRVYAQVRDAAGNESLVLSAPTKYVKTQAGPVDQAAPALQTVTVPNPARTQEVTVTLVATDDVGVTHVRLANEDGTWSAWKPFVADVPHQLTAGNTYKVVYAQVRDAAGRESNVLFTRTLLQP